MIMDINKGDGTCPQSSENVVPNLTRHITIKENMMNIFYLLETKNTTPLVIVCDDAFAI
jgi:hypothetical protein